MHLLKLLLILFVCAAGPAAAGPLDDGLAAYKNRDWETAVRLLLPLAEQGNAQAQEKIGRLYNRGKGFSRDYGQAEKWYRKAAEQDDAAAQSRLAFMYRTGTVDGPGHMIGRNDYVSALHWYRKAAEQGNPLAQVGLGYMSWGGEGMPADYVAAATWLRKAAEQGNALAQLGLGTLYELGNGVPKDYVQAYKWYQLATVDDGEYEAGLFDRAKQSRDIVTGRMTRQQIADAQKLAREWKPKPGP